MHHPRYYWRMDWQLFAVGVAIAVAVLGFSPDTPPLVLAGLFLVIGLIGGMAVHRTPAIDHEAPWIARVDRIRDMVDELVLLLDKAYIIYRSSTEAPATWKELVNEAPAWPDGDDQPLCLWKTRFYQTAPEPIRQLYDFAVMIDSHNHNAGIGALGTFERSDVVRIHVLRRQIINALDVFGHQLQDEADGMSGFLERYRLRSTCLAPIVVLVFFDILKAETVRDLTPPVHVGFWWLGRHWFPK